MSDDVVKIPAIYEDGEREIEIKAVKDVFGGDAPGSLYSIMPKVVRNAVDKCRLSVFTEPAHALERHLKSEEEKIFVGRARFAFWYEVGYAKRTGKMQLTRVHAPFCSLPEFKKLLEDPIKISLMLKPPVDWEVAMREQLHYATEKMREILATPDIDPETGLMDAKLADVKRRIWEHTANVVKGMPAQRIETKNLNLNYETHGSPEEIRDAIPQTPEEIDARLAELEGEIK